VTQAQQALAAITAYTAGQSLEDVRGHRFTVWEALVQGAAGYDAEASAEADPSQANEQAVFADGSRLWWNAALKAWETGPAVPEAPKDVTVLVHSYPRPSPPARADARPFPPEAVAMLQADHRQVQELLASYQHARDFTTRQQIAARVFSELDRHTQLEEAVFYPAYEGQTGKQGTQLVADSRREHEAVRRLIMEMQHPDITEAEFEDKFTALGQHVQHHIAQEEHEMFPEAAQILADQMEDLRDQMVALRHQMRGGER
jgi:hemerythrin-like domain-containing protein